MSDGLAADPDLRREFFASNRLGGDDVPDGADPTGGPIGSRAEQLRSYRAMLAATQSPPKTRRGRGRSALTRSTAVAGQLNWIPIGPSAVMRGQASGLPVVSGRCQDLGIAGNGQRIYAGTANGGVWRSLDGGDSWTAMSDEFDKDPLSQQVDSLSVGALALIEGADADHDRLYVGTGEGFAGPSPGRPTDFLGMGMLLSTDGGRNWTQEAAAPPLLGFGVFEIAVDPVDPEHALAATTNGLYRRVSAAAGWVREQVGTLGLNATFTSVVAARRGGATRFYSIAAGLVHEGTTTPAAWTLVAGFPGGAGRVSLAASASDPPTVYALAAAASAFNGVHRIEMSLPAASPWSTVASTPSEVFGSKPPGQGHYDQAIVVDPNDPTVLYIGGSGQNVSGEFSANIFRLEVSADGTGFRCKSNLIGGGAHADVHALKFRPGSSGELWAGSDGGVYRANDAKGSSSSQFESRNVGLATLTMMGLGHHPSEESYAFCGAQDNGGIRYLGDEVWDHQLPGDGGDTVIDWNTGDRLINGYVKGDVRRASIDGNRYDSSGINPPIGAQAVLFYPPIVGVDPTANAADASVVAFGAETPFVSTDFGSNWGPPLPARADGSHASLRSLCFAGPSRLYAGWEDGKVGRFDHPATGWVLTDISLAGEARPVTCIAVDPADATGSSVFITLGGFIGVGNRVRHVNSAPAVPVWTSPSAGLLDVTHNAIVIDPSTPTTRFAAADLGVWRWDDPTSTWQAFSGNLPDAAVLDLDLLPGGRLLRATTHGRGVFEMDISRPNTPAVELILRANTLDQRRRDARAGATQLRDRSHTSRLDESPDIVVDAPASNGAYAIDLTRPPNLVRLLDRRGANTVLASVPEALATTRVYVTVRDRGIRPANPSLDAVRVALLIGPAGDDDTSAPAPLPANFAQAAIAGTPIDDGGWKTVGIHDVGGLRAGAPATAVFELRSDVLPVADESSGKRFVLLAIVHHADDPFPANAVLDPVALVTTERHSAMRRVVVATASGAATAGGGSASGAPVNPVGGTGLLVPVSATLLAHQRLSDVVDQLDRKIHTGRVSPGFGSFQRAVSIHPVERRVLAMATAARDAMRAGPAAGVPRGLPGAGIGSYALLGALGFELPGFTSVLAPGGGWVADLMRRGTPDPDKSQLAVPSSEFPLAVGRLGINAATATAATKQRITAFSTGMLAAAAAGVTVGPQLADLLAADTNTGWHRHSPSTGAAALERHLRRRFLGGDETASTLATWLPAAADVPAELWDAYVKALDEVYHLPGTRPAGFPAFEDGFDAGDPVTAVRLRNAYGLVVDDLRTSSWPWPAWWGLLSPILLAPSFAMLIARELPHAKAFFEADTKVTERSVFELLTVAMGLGSLAPFIYSMILWGAVDEHTEAFATSLLFFLARAGLVAGGLGTSKKEDQSELTRWLGIFAPLASLDVYALIRAAIAGKRRPGVATVFGLQTIPSLTGLVTLGVSGLLKVAGISHDWPFWLSWSVHTAGVLFGIGIPLAIAFSNGGGWRSWFMRADRRFPLLSSVAATGALPAEPVAMARVFDPSTLWADPATADPDLSAYLYPSGMRPLAKLWWEGGGTLEVQHDADRVVLRNAGATTPIRLPVGTTAASMVVKLGTGLAGIKAKQPKDGGLDPALPWPRTLADPGDSGPLVDAPVGRQRFVPVGDSEKESIVLRHAPRADLSTQIGRSAGSADPFPVIPAASLGDIEGSGLGDAADLATLLAMAAQPAFAPVAVADGLLPALADPSVKEVVQVFRRWNLDERRVEEWQSLVSGGAPAEGAPPAGANPFLRKPPVAYAGAQAVGSDLADAMGWLPLWRAWLRMSSDPAADAGATIVRASTPLVRFRDGSVRRPTNAELTEGMRFLLDLGAV